MAPFITWWKSGEDVLNWSVEVNLMEFDQVRIDSRGFWRLESEFEVKIICSFVGISSR
jgi:hypothetical protein